jgi:hypothetical protein
MDGCATDEGAKQESPGDQRRASNAQAFQQVAHQVTSPLPTPAGARVVDRSYNPLNLST